MIDDLEKKFLHDIASPVGTALFLIDMIIDDANSKDAPNDQPSEKLKQLLGLLMRMKSMIEERRSVLTQRDEKE